MRNRFRFVHFVSRSCLNFDCWISVIKIVEVAIEILSGLSKIRFRHFIQSMCMDCVFCDNLDKTIQINKNMFCNYRSWTRNFSNGRIIVFHCHKKLICAFPYYILLHDIWFLMMRVFVFSFFVISNSLHVILRNWWSSFISCYVCIWHPHKTMWRYKKWRMLKPKW